MATYNFIDRTGQVFGRLTVIARAPNVKGRTFWNCLCECGEYTSVRGEHLKNGVTESCGCYSIESHRKHNMSNTPEYRAWTGLKDRCLNKSNRQYRDYGGRGITVCDQWLNSFESFFSDMGARPEGLTIDRINNDLGYSPDNCKWATRKEQVDNRRNSIPITIDGVTKCQKDWCRHYGKNYTTVRSRVAKGMSIIEALTK